ncbi:MAG: hypothetical protein ACNA7U_03645 [Candidatus Izemoplasmataceae bacterium]
MAKHNRLFIVYSAHPHWVFLNGYYCYSKTSDHFLRHLSYKFYRLTDIYSLNNAHKSNEIIIDILKSENFPPSIPPKKPFVVDGYFDDFGYVIEVNHGDMENDIIEKLSFVNEYEAGEWIKRLNA